MSKPTQQEIIELAREVGITTIHNGYHPVSAFTADQLERFATLLLERFGAGGGEPVTCDGDFPEGFNPSLGIPAQALRTANAIMFDVIGKREWDVPCTAQHLLSFVKSYTHPSPTDLRAEYLRGLGDAAKVCEEQSQEYYPDGTERGLHWQCASAIRALKGKQ